MSTVCKHRHRGDKGGRAWCEPPHPHPRIGGRGRHRKLPALANNSGRTRTPRWRRVDLHDRRRRVEPPAHRLLPERVREGQLGSAPSCGAASVVGTQHQRRHSPTWNCAQVLALPGAAGMATMQRKLAGKKQGVGGFLLTATIGDNYLCQPHDGATRGGARPAVAATASCPTPHATARGTLRPCGVTDSRAELVRVRSKCHRRCQPRALCPVSSPMLPNCTTVNLTGRYEMTFSSTSTPTSVLNAKKPLYWTRPLHTAHLIVPFPPWATSCVASFLPIEYSYVDVSDSKQYSSSVKMWTTDLSQTPILHRGPHALHTSSEPQQRRLDVPACPLNDT
ncbi:uncharacterized protein LOC142930154 isoform X5 [Petromyzon marinus]|uniref:uncharacterized protein LOC142930154 isoform X5 n=1 Tax=Petromyzon marinus TaxID=7757 RepID=UPI003F725E21